MTSEQIDYKTAPDQLTYCEKILTNIGNVVIYSVGFEFECRQVRLLVGVETPRTISWKPLDHTTAIAISSRDSRRMAVTNYDANWTKTDVGGSPVEMAVSFSYEKPGPFKTGKRNGVAKDKKAAYSFARELKGITNLAVTRATAYMNKKGGSEGSSVVRKKILNLNTVDYSTHLEVHVLVREAHENRGKTHLWEYFKKAFEHTLKELNSTIIPDSSCFMIGARNKPASKTSAAAGGSRGSGGSKALRQAIIGVMNPAVTLDTAEWAPQLTVCIGLGQVPDLFQQVCFTQHTTATGALITNPRKEQVEKAIRLTDSIMNRSGDIRAKVGAHGYRTLRGFVFWVVWVVSTFNKIHLELMVEDDNKAIRRRRRNNTTQAPPPTPAAPGRYEKSRLNLFDKMRFQQNILMNPRNSVCEMFDMIQKSGFTPDVVNKVVYNTSRGIFGAFQPKGGDALWQWKRYTAEDTLEVTKDEIKRLIRNTIPSIDPDSNVSRMSSDYGVSMLKYEANSPCFNASIDKVTTAAGEHVQVIKVFFEYRGMGIIKAGDKTKRSRIFTSRNMKARE